MAENGSKRKVYVVSTGTPGVFTAIGGEMSNSLTVNGVIIDISDKDSDWAQNIVGQKSWTLSATFNIKKGASEKQQVLFDALVAGTEVNLAIGEVVSAAFTDGYKGKAVIESFAESNEKDGSVTRDISFVGNGELEKIDAA